MMPMAMEYYPSNVRDGLERLCEQINIDNRRNMTDLNKSAENFFVEFLNLLFGLELKNANPGNPNRPGFDLIDEKNQIIVQVSSECTHKKIQEALGNSADKVGFHFYFVAIRASYSPREPFDVPTALQFDYTKDVLDIKRLMDLFDGCGIEKQEKLSALVDRYFKRITPQSEPDKPTTSRDPGIADDLADFQGDWDKDAFLTEGVPLKNIYYPPQCYLNGNTKERLGLEDAESRLNNSRKKDVLILGQPGNGKSTLISQFVSSYRGSRQIIVYRCQSLTIKNWNDEEIYQTVLSQAALSGINLSNSILILDGLDEVAGKETLDAAFENLVSSHLNNRSIDRAAYLVITCRENYIKKLNAAGAYNYIQLCPFDEDQIQEFCEHYGDAVSKPVPAETVSALCENEEVYGIPLIAYMVLALGIKANAKSGIVDVYDQIFDPKGGSESSIYKRPYDLGADTGGEEMWQKLHQLSQDMALWIFHNNFEKEEIPKDRLDRFAEEYGLEPQKGLDHFRKLHHSESDNQSVTFIHRSMMEYFVADGIAREICLDRSRPADKPSDAIEKVSGMLYWRDIHSGECAEYLSKMLEAGFGKLEKSEKKAVYQRWELAVFQQLEAGVPLQSIPEKIECSFTIRLKAEKIYCNNLIWVLRILRDICRISEKIGSYARKQMSTDRYDDVIPLYIRLDSVAFDAWCLIECDLMGAHLSGAYLSSADLSGADLSCADLSDADLVLADLHDADLVAADLNGADLNNAVLDRDSAFKAIKELRVANFDSIRIWDRGTLTIYTRREFFAIFDR